MKPTQEQVIAWAREAGFDIEKNIWGASESVYVDGGWITNRLAAAMILAYEAGRESMKWDGIHTCHDQCQRPACIARRNAYEEGYEAGRKDENEACAVRVSEVDADGWQVNMAEIIRARREQ